MNLTIFAPRFRRLIFGIFASVSLFTNAGCQILNETVDSKALEAESIAKVGAYYYPWFKKDAGPEGLDWMNQRQNTWRENVMRFKLKPSQKPLLGCYDSEDPEVIGGHIEQSVRGGVDFWAVSWWGPETPTDQAFREAILTHPQSDKLEYAVLYEATGRFGEFSAPSYDKWLDDLAYMKEHYFEHPSYLKIDGRPVLFVYLTRQYFRGRGEDALADLRAAFPEVYLVGDDVFFSGAPDETYKPEWAQQFDAVTAYDVYGQSVGPLGGTRAAVDFLAGNYAKAKKVANSVGTGFIPAIAPGYNDTAVREGHPGRARYFSDVPDSVEGDVFRSMIADVALPNVDELSDRIFMVTSFNEWYEDTQIEPTSGTQEPAKHDSSPTGADYTGGQTYYDYGYLYLDILREMIP